MYPAYINLVNFINAPYWNTPSEARLRINTLNWIGEAVDILTSDYWFTVEYQFSLDGIATSTTVRIEKKNEEGKWVGCGTYTPDSGVKLVVVLDNCDCKHTESECGEPSDKPSNPVHYYVPNYYVPGYYV